jgi:hypothetical protein
MSSVIDKDDASYCIMYNIIFLVFLKPDLDVLRTCNNKLRIHVPFVEQG